MTAHYGGPTLMAPPALSLVTCTVPVSWQCFCRNARFVRSVLARATGVVHVLSANVGACESLPGALQPQSRLDTVGVVRCLCVW